MVRKYMKTKALFQGRMLQTVGLPEGWRKSTRQEALHDCYRSQEGGRVRIGPVSDHLIYRPLRPGQGSRDQGGAAKQLPDGTHRDQEPPEPR